MRVGIFVQSIPQDLGGAFTFVETVLSSFEAGQKHEIFVFHYGSAPAAAAQQGIRLVRLGSAGVLRKLRKAGYGIVRAVLQPLVAKLSRVLGSDLSYPAGSRLDSIARKYSVDLLWFPSPDYEWTSCPYIATVWDLEHREQTYFPEVSARGEWEGRERFFSALLPRASYVVTGTQVGKQEIVQHYGISPERIRLLPHPTPSFALNEKRKHPPLERIPRPYILYPAQFWAHKNHVGLLNALKWVHEQGQKLHLVFVGSDKGNKAHIQGKVQELGLGDFVHFQGFVSRDELTALYQNAEVLAYPSLCGPENLPPLEAMAFGVPVVAADIPGSREQLREAALLADALNPEAFGKALLQALDASVRHFLIEKGRARASHYTGREFAVDLRKIIEEFSGVRALWGR